MKIGFIGLGQMGSGMAANLVAAGHDLAVYNRSRQKAESFAKGKVRVAASPADAATGAEVVISMLADDHAVSEVVFGEQGLASALGKDAIHVSSSTISVALARRLTVEHGQRGQGFLSVPVFGRPEAAASAKLIIVMAGDERAIDKCKPVGDVLGRQTFVVGAEPWQANAVKVSGNFMIASMLETFGEAFAVMGKAGIERQKFLEIMTELFGSPVYKNYGTMMADQKFEPAGFALKLGLKDVKLAIEAAEGLQAPLPLASLLRDQLISALAHGQEKLDWSSLALVAARNAGL
ncbi:MAG TPA: NAD(P)-dependent oxidoreductase [Bryobacteraceae bacterium]|nr:NAD(P)-dependent oxidoreductase [Bryobacteraceae bacterium]